MSKLYGVLVLMKPFDTKSVDEGAPDGALPLKAITKLWRLPSVLRSMILTLFDLFTVKLSVLSVPFHPAVELPLRWIVLVGVKVGVCVKT